MFEQFTDIGIGYLPVILKVFYDIAADCWKRTVAFQS